MSSNPADVLEVLMHTALTKITGAQIADVIIPNMQQKKENLTNTARDKFLNTFKTVIDTRDNLQEILDNEQNNRTQYNNRIISAGWESFNGGTQGQREAQKDTELPDLQGLWKAFDVIVTATHTKNTENPDLPAALNTVINLLKTPNLAKQYDLSEPNKKN